MPFDFSELDMSPEEQKAGEIPSDVERIVFEPETPQEPDQFDEQMSEVEKKLEIASYYRLLLKNSLFTDNSATAAIIDSEIRGFIKDRLGILLGLTTLKEPAVVVSQFSEEEAVALKQLAAKIIASPGVLDSKKPIPKKEEKKPPELRRVETQPQAAPQRKPTQVAVKAPPAVSTTAATAKAPAKRGRPRTNFSPHAAPMPTGQAYTMIAAQQAERASSSGIEQGGIAGGLMIAGAMSMPAKKEE